MAIFAVTYTYSPDVERLAAIRPQHRAFLTELHATGHVIVSGPLPGNDDDPAGGALIIMETPTIADAETLLDGDPFHREKLIANRTTRQWQPVIGSLHP
jgi:uncharacterized protein YciI